MSLSSKSLLVVGIPQQPALLPTRHLLSIPVTTSLTRGCQSYWDIPTNFQSHCMKCNGINNTHSGVQRQQVLKCKHLYSARTRCIPSPPLTNEPTCWEAKGLFASVNLLISFNKGHLGTCANRAKCQSRELDKLQRQIINQPAGQFYEMIKYPHI